MALRVFEETECSLRQERMAETSFLLGGVTVRGYLDTETYGQIWPLVELPIEGAEFVRLRTLEEAVYEAIGDYADLRVAHLTTPAPFYNELKRRGLV